MARSPQEPPGRPLAWRLDDQLVAGQWAVDTGHWTVEEIAAEKSIPPVKNASTISSLLQQVPSHRSTQTKVALPMKSPRNAAPISPDFCGVTHHSPSALTSASAVPEPP